MKKKTAWVVLISEGIYSRQVGRNLRTHAAARRAAKRLKMRYGHSCHLSSMPVNSDSILRA